MSMTQCQQMLLDKYKVNSEEDKMIMMAVGIGAKEYDFEEEVMEFLTSHPEATLKELYDFAKPFFPELVIVDDDEMDEDDEQ